jgi:hypothetical protein
MDEKRSASVPARNKRRKKVQDNAEKAADVIRQIAETAKLGPGQQALARPMPLVRARGKGKAKAKRKNEGLATIMEYNDVGDDPYVMRR